MLQINTKTRLICRGRSRAPSKQCAPLKLKDNGSYDIYIYSTGAVASHQAKERTPPFRAVSTMLVQPPHPLLTHKTKRGTYIGFVPLSWVEIIFSSPVLCHTPSGTFPPCNHAPPATIHLGQSANDNAINPTNHRPQRSQSTTCYAGSQRPTTPLAPTQPASLSNQYAPRLWRGLFCKLCDRPSA